MRDDQENETGIVCFGAAILENVDRPVASLSVSIPLFRVGEAARYSRPLTEAVASISRQLGYIEPNDPGAGKATKTPSSKRAHR